MVLQLQTMVLYWAALGFETFRSLASLKHFCMYIFWKGYIHPRIYRNIQKKTLNIRRYKCYLSSSSLLLNTCFSDKAKKQKDFTGHLKMTLKIVIWHIFRRMEPKWKKNLRLSHQYKFLSSKNSCKYQTPCGILWTEAL